MVFLKISLTHFFLCRYVLLHISFINVFKILLTNKRIHVLDIIRVCQLENLNRNFIIKFSRSELLFGIYMYCMCQCVLIIITYIFSTKNNYFPKSIEPSANAVGSSNSSYNDASN